ncbi:MAG TPA: ABC transporter substrate-binding protein [Acidimicrobiales bacterium]
MNTIRLGRRARRGSRRRFTHALAVGAAFLLIATACGDDGEASGGAGDTAADQTDAGAADTSRRLRLVGTNGPQHMDPVTGVTPCEAEPLRWVYDSLIRIMPDGSFAPGLAESWESPDPNTFVLHLRQGVKFQDGTDFNADAVRQHLERGRSDERSVLAGVLEPIESIETPDEHTVVLHLSEPRAGVLPTLFTDRAGMVPSPAAVADAGENYGANDAVGAGPYAYDSHVPSGDIHVTAWDGYWDAENRFFAGIDMLGAAEEFQVQRIESGELDYAAMKDAQLAEAEAGKARGTIDFRLSPTTQYAEIYINWAKPPFDDVRVRQALEHAVDRELLVESLTDGSATVAWSPLPADSWAHDPAVEEMYPYDPQRARELLAEAGYPNGVQVTVGMIDNPYYSRLSQAVQDMVRESGFEFELEPVTGNEINNRLYELKDLPVAITAYRGQDDPGLTLENKFSSEGNSNPAGITAAGLDELLDKGAASIDQAERAEFYKQAERIIMEEALSVPLFHNGGLVSFVPELVGVERGYTTCQFALLVGTGVHFERE